MAVLSAGEEGGGERGSLQPVRPDGQGVAAVAEAVLDIVDGEAGGVVHAAPGDGEGGGGVGRQGRNLGSRRHGIHRGPGIGGLGPLLHVAGAVVSAGAEEVGVAVLPAGEGGRGLGGPGEPVRPALGGVGTGVPADLDVVGGDAGGGVLPAPGDGEGSAAVGRQRVHLGGRGKGIHQGGGIGRGRPLLDVAGPVVGPAAEGVRPAVLPAGEGGRGLGGLCEPVRPALGGVGTGVPADLDIVGSDAGEVIFPAPGDGEGGPAVRWQRRNPGSRGKEVHRGEGVVVGVLRPGLDISGPVGGSGAEVVGVTMLGSFKEGKRSGVRKPLAPWTFDTIPHLNLDTSYAGAAGVFGRPGNPERRYMVEGWQGLHLG